jgi:putative copper resistance protein D
MALAVACGGVVYALWGLRPLGPSSPLTAAAVARAVWLIGAAALVLAVARTLSLVLLHPWALADETGRWPLRAFLGTDYATAGLVSVGLALGLAAAARAEPAARAPWVGLALLAGALLASSGWLAHAVSRLEHRGPLMAATILHQTGAVLWVGGLVHLAAFWALARCAAPADPLGPALVRRFSVLAMTGIVLVLAPGLYLAWSYIGDWGALVGTGYGVMVLTKVALLAAVLTLGGLNFLLGRAWTGAGPTGARVRALVEAEVGVGLTVLMAAAALTSLPPSVDVVQDRATPAEVAQHFTPRLPRLVSPAVGQLIAEAAPIDDTLATRQPVEYAWSEYNHHMAGLFVLTMGALALLERTGRARWARHWPLAMLGLAAFLFVRNDPRAWPLGPAGFWESLVLPDVLQHRVAVGLVVALALFEWAVRTGRLQRPGFGLVFPVLSAAGGAMLLTHSHAMFNLKAEFLTEVSHAPMGVLAVFTGWGRWLELRLPAGDGKLPGWIWSASLALIGMILLFYREG